MRMPVEEDQGDSGRVRARACSGVCDAVLLEVACAAPVAKRPCGVRAAHRSVEALQVARNDTETGAQPMARRAAGRRPRKPHARSLESDRTVRRLQRFEISM
jgi:hypothetical protein